MKKIFAFFGEVFSRFDPVLLGLGCCSAIYGLFLIMSATASFGTKKLVVVQLGALVMGLAAAFVIVLFDYENLCALSRWIYVFCAALLVLTLFIAEERLGNKNWIIVGPLSMQPSEFVKVGFVVTFAAHVSKIKDDVSLPRGIIPLILHFGVIFALVVLEGDLGTALVYLFMFIIMMFAAGLHWLYFAISGVTVLAAAPFVFNSLLKDYQQKRILAVYDPSLDPTGFGYQMTQSTTAVGSGGLYGQGYMHGIQTQYSILPEKQTDFIFSVAGEELGFFGSAVIILLLCALILRVFYVAKNARDTAGMVICAGAGAVFLFQAAVNIGMCLGLLPVVGITLPFFSYGGSSMLSCMCLLGLVMSVNSHRRGGFFKK